MRTYKKITALLLSCILLTSSAAKIVHGAPASLQIDETLYVNLNFYGETDSMSIVKGYTPSNSDTISDYGIYDEVINMSNYAVPEIDEGKVTFKFDEAMDNRFYFEGKMKNDAVELPWNIDVSYKLNGVEKNADELAGEKGLVEISIDAVPNEKTSEYFKNNMILQIAATVNMDENLSVEAEGAQIQTLGNIKAVVFMVMPSEEQHFTLKIGSNDFSFNGLMMMMVPGKLSQIEDIRKLRESKEKIEDSADAMNDSLDILLDTMNGLKSGLDETSRGLRELDNARAIMSSEKDNLLDEADTAIESLKKISEASKPFTEHLENTKKLLIDTNSSLNQMTNTANDFKPIISDAKTSIENIRTDIEGLKTMVLEMDENSELRQSLTEQTKKDLEILSGVLADLSLSLGGSMSSMPSISGLSPMADTGGLDPKTDMMIAMVNSKISEVNSTLNSLSAAGSALTSETGDTLSYLGELSSSAQVLVDDLNASLSLLDTYMNSIETHSDDVTNIAEDSNALLESLNNSLSLAEALIDDSSSLTDVLNEHEAGAEQTASDAKSFVESAIEGIDSTQEFLSTANAVARQSSDSLDAGTASLLSGTISALSSSIDGLAQTDTIRNAKDTIKNTIDDEWDEYSGDKMGFLNMDETLEPVSFTSALNPAPQSVQIVLRTEEITVDDDDEAVNVDEDFHAEGNFLTRIGNIFKQIFSKIKSIFSK
ncbi:MAG: hypothetical protein HFE62_02245 [Firmicutes bacterium]|nr:hypothetical protein [Bacillota bacterium]